MFLEHEGVPGKGVVPKFESILNDPRSGTILDSDPGCYNPCALPCISCYTGCVGCNLVPENGQANNLVSNKLDVGDDVASEYIHSPLL